MKHFQATVYGTINMHYRNNQNDIQFKKRNSKKGNLILKSQHSSLLEMSHETRGELISDMITLLISPQKFYLWIYKGDELKI